AGTYKAAGPCRVGDNVLAFVEFSTFHRGSPATSSGPARRPGTRACRDSPDGHRPEVPAPAGGLRPAAEATTIARGGGTPWLRGRPRRRTRPRGRPPSPGARTDSSPSPGATWRAW